MRIVTPFGGLDPEIPVNIYDLKLIYDVDPEGAVNIDMSLTSPNCPAAQSLPAELEAKAEVPRAPPLQRLLSLGATMGPEMSEEETGAQRR